MKRPALLTLLAACACCFCGCPSVDWSENYAVEGREPFDLLALHELLAARPAGVSDIRGRRQLAELDTLDGRTYLFVGQYPYYTDTAVIRLLDYVEKGNDAFIAAEWLPEDLSRALFGANCEADTTNWDETHAYEYFPDVYLDTAVAFRYPGGDSFLLTNVHYWKPAVKRVSVIEEELLCTVDTNHQVLGGIDTAGINFVRFTWGEGAFYLHTNPLFFTNWYVLDSQQYRYPQAMLEVLGTEAVAWDESSRRYRRAGGGSEADRDYYGGRNLLNGNETLRYIQQHPALAFAWYSLLAGVLLYVIFRGKRRQRIIPFLPRRENSSRRFVETISRLVLQKGNHAALAQRELSALRFHLNQRLGVRWAEGQPPPQDLVERLGLPPEVTRRALTQIRVVSAGRPLEEGDLLRFYRAIAPLYRL